MRIIYQIAVFLVLLSCNKDDNVTLGSEAELLSFRFKGVQSTSETTGNEIFIKVHFVADITALTPVFNVSEGARVFVGDEEQVSGSTTLDFTETVTYRIVAEDGSSEQEWIVDVEKLPEPQYSVSTLVSDFPGNDGISVDTDGNIYVNSNGSLNAWNGTSIYKVTPSGSSSLFASNLPSWPVGSEIVGDNLLVTGWKAPGVVTQISLANGGTTQLHTGIAEASGLEVDDQGNIYVMEPPTNSVIRYSTSGGRSVFASGGVLNGCSGITHVESSGNFYVTNWKDGRVSKISSTGQISSFVNLPVNNLGPVMNDGEFLYITSYNHHQVFSVKISTGEYEVIAGTGSKGNKDGYGDLASFNSPLGIGMSPDGETLYVSEVSPNGKGRLRMIKRNK